MRVRVTDTETWSVREYSPSDVGSLQLGCADQLGVMMAVELGRWVKVGRWLYEPLDSTPAEPMYSYER